MDCGLLCRQVTYGFMVILSLLGTNCASLRILFPVNVFGRERTGTTEENIPA